MKAGDKTAMLRRLVLCRSSFLGEFSDRRHNTGLGDKSIVFLHLPRKFRAGQLGLLSINFDFRNVIFQPIEIFGDGLPNNLAS